jgi:hypothetical protein
MEPSCRAGSFNNDSEGKHMSDSRIKEHMEVIGADGVHIGTVDRVENGKIKLIKAWSRTSKDRRCACPRTAPLPSPWKKRPASRADHATAFGNSAGRRRLRMLLPLHYACATAFPIGAG